MLKLEELEVYQMAMGIGEAVWKFVDTREYFAKRTIGVKSVGRSNPSQ